MKVKDKELLLKDLCARLPYGVIVETYWEFENKKEKTFPKTILTYGMLGYYIGEDKWKYNTHFLPFLRPMSSMTEGEVKEFAALESIDVLGGDIKITSVKLSVDAIDWLNSHHFDYRGLIPMGLALEAPEGMYNIKEE